MAFALYGLGNVAFAGHDGSPLGLALLRYSIGLLLLSVFVSRSVPGLLAAMRTPVVWLLAVTQMLANVAFVFAAKETSLVVFVLFEALTPVIVTVSAPLLGYRRLTRAEALAGAAAVAGGVGVLYFGESSTDGNVPGLSLLGFSLLLGGVIAGAAATLTAPAAARIARPEHLLSVFCLTGTAFSGILLLSGVEFRASESTLYSAVFLAVIAGGIAKLMVWWAAARMPPQQTALLKNVSVASALLLGAIILGEVPTSGQLVACTVLLLAVAFLVRKSPDRKEPPLSRGFLWSVGRR